jgi:hypothetical protein
MPMCSLKSVVNSYFNGQLFTVIFFSSSATACAREAVTLTLGSTPAGINNKALSKQSVNMGVLAMRAYYHDASAVLATGTKLDPPTTGTHSNTHPHSLISQYVPMS